MSTLLERRTQVVSPQFVQATDENTILFVYSIIFYCLNCSQES